MTDQTNSDHDPHHGSAHQGQADHGPSTPVEVDDSDLGAGAATGIWVTGLLCVVLLLLAFFAL